MNSVSATQNTLDEKLHWYKDAIIYELHIKAFADSNGDGIGDFAGLIQKLDYLQSLGVTAIWLLPFYPSPLRDDGYDIADYYNINPAYGNVAQFRQLLDEAHHRNLRVITELVLNHTSDQHPWFQRARLAPKDSPERAYYVWSDDPNQYRGVRIIFQDFETSNWTWDPVAQQYYWHRFFHHQPDLNFDNPLIRDEVFKILDYWCDMGVDGFRLDAVPYLFEREGTNCENLPETHAFLKELRKHVDQRYPGTLLLAEANMWPEDAASYFGDGDECQMNYHFPVMPRMFMAMQMEERYPITDIFDQTPEIPHTCQWAIFLRNHDELTLEMVTDEERDYMYKVYVKDPKARINLGIRHRLAPLMDNDRKKIELLNCLLFSLPGTPVIYYGDEIGMGDNFYLGDRDGVRTPMQWSDDRNAGFSDANPHRLYLPVILDPQYHYESVNVALQLRNTSSLLWWTKRMISMRRKHLAFSRGDMKFIAADNPKVLAFTRTYQEETMLVVVNLARYSQPVCLDLSAYKGAAPIEVFSHSKFPEVREEQAYFMTLSPHACEWFLLHQPKVMTENPEEAPVLHLPQWEALPDRPNKERLEQQVLPAYLQQVRWFGGKSRQVQHVRIAGLVPVETEASNAIFLSILEIHYESGLPDMYQLPLACAMDSAMQKLIETCPNAILARLMVQGKEGLLYDGYYSHDLHRYLLQAMAENRVHGALQFSGSEHLAQYNMANPKARSKVLSAEQSNTSITYENAWFLKLYRKVDKAINPDLEITQYLTSDAHFPQAPQYAGAIEWKGEGTGMVLGMLQALIDGGTDAWKYILDRLAAFNETILTKPDWTAPESFSLHLTTPVNYESLADEHRELMDAAVAERVRLLGVRTGEMHLALAAPTSRPEFQPEDFSLHYQRSLFSSFQTLVRATLQTANRTLKKLPPSVRPEVEEVLAQRERILSTLKRIYAHPINVVKTRIHGDYHLGQVLFTGKDLVILDFEGEPARSYSERRLKRSPLRDVAGMVRSFHYAAYGALFLSHNITEEDRKRLMPFAEAWYQYTSSFFVHAYLDTVKHAPFIPDNREDLSVLLQTYILEKAVYELNYELNNRPDWTIIPARSILSILDRANHASGQ